MRTVKALFLFLLYAALCAPAQTNSDPNAQKAQKLVQQAIQAMGGEAFLKIQDVQQDGRGYGFYHGGPNGIGIGFVRYYKFPDMERIDFFKRHDWVIRHYKGHSYETTFQGTRELEPEQEADYNRNAHYSLDRVLREWTKDPRVAYFYEGHEIAGTKEAEKVTIMNSQNEAVTLLLDMNTHLPLKKSYSYRDKDRELNEEAESYDEYRPEQGFMTPHVYSRWHNGEMTSQRFYAHVRYNQGLAESFFTPPAVDFGKKK
jgi:hypothetical protein